MQSLSDIDWDNWRPVDLATLLFVVRDEQVLLIRKKRGLGAGKINGPGGRLEPGESPLDCAVRETEEELVTTPTSPVASGELQFQFVDGYSIHVHVFRAGDCDREPRETAEAIPIWARVDAVPYDEMWADDRIWLPLLLREEPFHGRFLFDDDLMVDHEMLPHPPRAAVPEPTVSKRTASERTASERAASGRERLATGRRGMSETPFDSSREQQR
ncbi:MAG: 8-oxo-dGTP diphosphatase [Acidobacteriota bacterium]|nr:8-oxo-dGTP diphosphatase [Acidobacteriota bacterium]MDH3523458.1 8-oxo-dGTP diphosphatase [Acidobacteriota bacterium]